MEGKAGDIRQSEQLCNPSLKKEVVLKLKTPVQPGFIFLQQMNYKKVWFFSISYTVSSTSLSLKFYPAFELKISC